MAVSDTLIGTVFDGRYRIVSKLGAGGMADVYLAEDQELGRQVAIKILNDRHAADDSFIERFRREAKNAAGLSHPNIVSIYDRGEAEGTYYIAMEFLDGRSLKELIVGRGPAPIKVAIEYARNILAALAAAHKQGIVHRDIKPHNVLIGAEGRVKVTDFGIARSGASQMTEVGSIIGTAQYLSPEQARGAPVDQTSDLYSVGVVLYEMLTGQVPFTGDTPLEIAMKHLSEVPRPPSELRPEIPHDLDSVVLRALAKDPSERYQSAEEMNADLARVAEGLPVDPETEEAATAVLSGSGLMAAAPTSVIARPRPGEPSRPAPPGATPPAGYYGYEGPPRRRRPVWPWVLSVLLLAAAAGAAWFAYTKIQDQLNANKPVSVPLVEGSREPLAKAKIRDAGLVPRVSREFSDEIEQGVVISQSPDPGEKLQKNGNVDITVSKGKETVEVPSVIGKSQADAVSTLTNAGLVAKAFPVPSGKPVDTVTGQDPPPGETVEKGSKVRINVSSGPSDVSVPSVIGLPFDQASAALQHEGFAVSRRDVDSNDAADTVVDQSPSGSAPAGLDDHAQRLEGPQDLDRAGRDEPGRAVRARYAHERRLQGAGEEPGRDRPGPRRDRARPEPDGRHAVEEGDDGHDHGRSDLADRTAAAGPVSRRVRVAVLMGGRSSEHEISMASARSVLDALDPERYDAVTVEIGRDGQWELGTGEDGSVIETLPVPAAKVPATLGEVDVVFPVLHGPFGEDGTVQGLLELAGIPYVGAGVLGSALAMDKDVFKAVMRDRGVPVTRNITLRQGQRPENPFGYPAFVKPARLGSSVGISKVGTDQELAAAVQLAFEHDDKVLVEEFVDGIEVECGVLGNDRPIASLPGEIVSHGFSGADWYDYSAKYDEGGMDLLVPPRVGQAAIERVQELAVQSFVAGECEGMARVDFFVREDGEVLVNELNTIPGFTATSVYAKLFEASGVPYPELVDRLVQLALERHERKSRLRY